MGSFVTAKQVQWTLWSKMYGADYHFDVRQFTRFLFRWICGILRGWRVQPLMETGWWWCVYNIVTQTQLKTTIHSNPFECSIWSWASLSLTTIIDAKLQLINAFDGSFTANHTSSTTPPRSYARSPPGWSSLVKHTKVKQPCVLCLQPQPTTFSQTYRRETDAANLVGILSKTKSKPSALLLQYNLCFFASFANRQTADAASRRDRE